MGDLVERYLWAVVKDLPAGSRDDVARELRATIEDMIEARGLADDENARGGTDDETTRAVLKELGDPAALAAEYAGSRSLIGPALYSLYVRLLRMLLLIVIPIIVVVTAVTELFWSHGDALDALAAVIRSSIETAVWIAAIVTLVFAILERTGVTSADLKSEDGTWSVDSLPPVAQKRQIGLAEVVSSLIFLAVLIALLPWQRTHSPVYAEGHPVSFLDAGLWDWWIPVFIAILVVAMAIEVWKYASGVWTAPLVVANLSVNAAVAVFFVALLKTEDVVSPLFVKVLEEHTTDPLPGTVLSIVTALLIVGICVWDSVDCVLEHARGRQRAGELTGPPAGA